MHIIHLNCGTMCPFGGRLMDGTSEGAVAHLGCHCLLIETSAGLVLVDTGFGTADVRTPYPRLSRFFGTLNRIRTPIEQTALRQVEARGYRAADVRHIVLTHLDFDHAGGLLDFPAATLHLLSLETEAARDRRGFIGRRRYRPDQWPADRDWKLYLPRGETWMGFAAVTALEGLPPEVLLVPLIGHTHGHAGVAVDTGRGWLLHAGDAYFNAGEVRTARRRCPPGASLYQRMMAVDARAMRHNRERVRILSVEHPDIRVVCSHDVTEFRACTGDATGAEALPAANA
jgi:glyoxylase-like metal-dependent hydrolase (beta-lactamase superfamily II)